MHVITDPSDLEALFVPRVRFGPSDSYLIVCDTGTTFLHDDGYIIDGNGPVFVQADDDTYTPCTASDILTTCDSVLVIKFDDSGDSRRLTFDNLKPASNSELS